MPARMCGATRVAGGIYWETYSGWGVLSPAQHTSATMREAMRQRRAMVSLDPPVRIDPEALGLQAVGVKMIERNGVYHLLDWVGTSHYPNVADFVEEAANIGISRRMPNNLRFDLLTPESRLLLVHEKAWLDGRSVIWEYVNPSCPSGVRTHGPLRTEEAGIIPMCVRYWWNDLDQNTGTPVNEGGREVIRVLPCGASYTGWRRGAGLGVGDLPLRKPAIFASVKLERLALVRDRMNFTDDDIAVRLREQDVDYTRVDA
jgi:hypothetical protein